MVLHDGNDRTADGDRCSIQRVNQMRSFLVLVLESNVQPPGLVIGAIRSTRHFAPFPVSPSAWHPRL